jgi:hypothetical protein
MKDALNSFIKFDDLDVAGIFIYLIIDFDTSDSSEVMSSSVGKPVNIQIF